MKTATARDVRLDALRGVAVVLMVVDHVVKVVAPDSLWWVTSTVTRLSLPMFMVTAGVLLARRSHGLRPLRALDLFLAGSVVTVVFGAIGFALPDILVVMLLTAPLWSWVRRSPVLAVIFGLIQLVNLPLPWGGYQPGLVLALLGVGVLASGTWAQYGERLPVWCAAVGRRPLLFYVGHILLLPALAWAVS